MIGLVDERFQIRVSFYDSKCSLSVFETHKETLLKIGLDLWYVRP